MSKIAIIGGTGLTSLKNLDNIRREQVQTPYGEPSGPLTHGEISHSKVVFVARHGDDHTIPPHKVNYRANVWALKQTGAEYIIAVNAVGGIGKAYAPATLVIPDQIIDYTWSRLNTYFEEDLNHVVHIDFTRPYCEQLRALMIKQANAADISVIDHATYAATQGPRLETAAEIDRLEHDGCDIVGMTGMPEAALARELELCYASIAVVANMAAGRGDSDITMEIIEQNLSQGMVHVLSLLEKVISSL